MKCTSTLDHRLLCPWRSIILPTLQAEQSIHPGTVSNAIYGMVICDTVVSVAFLWGVLRRYVAWRQAGETFSALSKLALPRALLFGGLRAAVGAAALTLTHSPLGFRSHMRYQTLDATNGSRGTLAMNGARDALDLGEAHESSKIIF